jgi:cysteine desulfurase family protein (TIGR01976 family)
MTKGFDVDAVRAHFPALARELDGRAVAYLDGPAGTQVPLEMIAAMTAYLETSNANTHGAFRASTETDALLDEVHAAGADFVGAADGAEIVFGPNMTTLTFSVSRAIGRTLGRGDEIVVTRFDHDANVAPWLALEEERGVTIRWVGIRRDDVTLDLDALADALSPRTRLAAISLASNAVGTITPMRDIARLVHDAGALLWVDAVHAAPHMPLDVAALDADFLVCSPYKFYGPHLGMLWGRRHLLADMAPYKVRPSTDALPGRWETGTASHEMLAGLMGTFRYLEWLGTEFGGATGTIGSTDGRRARLRAAMTSARDYEQSLVPATIEGLRSVRGLRIHGITDPARLDERCPTFAFTLEGHHPTAIARFLGERGISVWDGNYYAYELVRALGLEDAGGMVRVGLVHYNTAAEVERLVQALHELVSRPG